MTTSTSLRSHKIITTPKATKPATKLTQKQQGQLD